MNAKISVFIICVEAIIYLLLYSLHDCTFKKQTGSKIKANTCFISRNSLRLSFYELQGIPVELVYNT